MKNKAFLLFLLCGISENPLTSAFSVISPYRTFPKKSSALFYEGKGDYYGEVDSTPMIREFATMEQLEEVVKLASQPLPERPDGIVTVVKFTSEIREECRATEAEYERVSRKHPDTLFLRCFEEFQDANVLMSQADVTVLPTFDIFYGGNRVGRVEGPKYPDVEDLIKRYGFINSKLDLFSEEADNKRKLRWGDGKAIVSMYLFISIILNDLIHHPHIYCLHTYYIKGLHKNTKNHRQIYTWI